MSRSTLDYFNSFAGPQGSIKLPSTQYSVQTNLNIVLILFTNKHLIYYWRPDAPVHMVTTNGRFYTHAHGTNSALSDKAK